jgi:L,D-transpeptidase ErfK/SrfK
MKISPIMIAAGLILAATGVAEARAEHRPPPASRARARKVSVIGHFRTHTVQPGETFLDIARKYDLGISALQAAYPKKNPWVLDAGSDLLIPSLWILPPTKSRGIVINVPEMRLYRFHSKRGIVSTHPVTVGEKETPTPIGTFRVVERKVDPQWDIPGSLQHKYKEKSVPPGEDNPIGKYWLGLSCRGYGIHGTDNPWSVGRIISNGCIRLYPEDIERLFPDVPKGTVVEIIYEPVKFGFRGDAIFVEVHEDLYGRIRNMEQHARKIARNMAIEDSVDWRKVRLALNARNGVPVPVGALRNGGETTLSLGRL